MSVNGELGGEPLRVGLPVVDMVTGLNAAIGILMALHERGRSGKGQFVETTLYDCGVSLLHPHLPNHYLSGSVPMRSGNAHPNIAPYDTFATGDAPIFLAVGNDRQFATLCSVIGRPDLPDDARFASNSERNAHRDELKQELESALSAFECDPVADRLIKAGVPCGAVRTIDQVMADPHTHHREMVVNIGPYRGTGSPIKMSRTPASYRLAPPRFGEHTAEILTEVGAEAEAYKEAPSLEQNAPKLCSSLDASCGTASSAVL